MNWEKTARKEKSLATGPSPNPAFDKLMMPHGFTREHNEPRSHAFALYDQVVVDRAFGGRFENKHGWQFLAQPGGNFKIWDVLVDQYPGEDHKAFKPGTAAAANPVCMSCKTRRPHPRLGLPRRPGARRQVEPHVQGRRTSSRTSTTR